MRHVILHYHILKNAGTTVRAVLEANFRGKCGDAEGPNPWDTIGEDVILEYAAAHPELKVISTHQGRLPAPVDSLAEFHPVVFLRHPIDRAASVYEFEHREPAESPSLGSRVARSNDLTEYVKWRLSDGNGAVIRNFQTVFLAGRERDMRSAIASREDLELALARLRELAFFGIVERFDESLARLKRYLVPHFGDLDIAYTRQNVSPGRQSRLLDRLDEIKSTLGNSLYDELVSKNALDLELYVAAVELFRQRETRAAVTQ